MAYIEYRLCEKFGWTVNELDEQPHDAIERFLIIMNIEGQFRKIEEQKQARGLKK